MMVVSPDWILDSIEANTRMEEERYHPSGLKKVEAETPGPMEVCNGGVSSMESGAPSERTQPDAPVVRNSAGKVSTMEAAKDGLHHEAQTSEGTSSHVSESVTSIVPPGPPVAPSADQEGANGSSTGGVVMPASPTPVTRAEQLLDGVVIYFTDYPDCVEDETLDKWKLVRK